MTIWKTLRDKHPSHLASVFVLTKSNDIVKAFYNDEDKKFYNRVGLVKPLAYKRWCYEDELVTKVLQEIGRHKLENE